MNYTQHSTLMATNWTNCQEDIVNQIQERNRRRIEDALADGCDYLRLKKIMQGDTFKVWLKSIGKTAAEATKYAKLYQVFALFSIESLAKVSLPTLFALCQKRYQQLVVKLRSLPAQTEVQMQQLMAEEREQQEAQKMQRGVASQMILPDTEQPKRDQRGLINLPSGLRAFQFPLLHNDEIITKILRLLEYREDILPIQLLGEAIALLFDREERARRQKEHLYQGYKSDAKSLKDCQHKASRVLQRIKTTRVVTS